MSNSARRKAMEQNADAQDRIADSQEEYFKYLKGEGESDRAMQAEIRDRILPFAMKLIENPGELTGERSAFPTIERPDFSGQITRDYSDDVAAISADRDRAIADADDFMTASGLARSGIRTGTAGSIIRGSELDRSTARRTMQSRHEGEKRDAYEDTRDLALRRHADTRGVEDRDTETRFAGLNLLQGERAALNPLGWHGQAAGNLEAASGTNTQAANSRYQAGNLPGVWSRIASTAAGLGGAAINKWG